MYTEMRRDFFALCDPRSQGLLIESFRESYKNALPEVHLHLHPNRNGEDA